MLGYDNEAHFPKFLTLTTIRATGSSSYVSFWELSPNGLSLISRIITIVHLPDAKRVVFTQIRL